VENFWCERYTILSYNVNIQVIIWLRDSICFFFQLSGIHPFTKSYLKPILACGGIIAIIYALTRSLLVLSYWMLPVIFILFLGIYGLCLVLTRSFDEEDIRLLLAIERRVGVDVGLIKRILKKFV